MGWSKNSWGDEGWYKNTSTVVGPPSLTFLSAFALTDSGANKTSSGTSIGAALATRIVFASVVGVGGSLPTSLTFTPNVGSTVTATLVISALSTDNIYASIWQAALPTGTTANITLAYSSNPFSNFEISLWSSDTSQMSSTTATGSAEAQLGTGNAAITATLNASAGGFIIAGAASNVTTSNSTTWSGGETYTKQFDTPLNGTQASFANASNVTGNASDTATATFAQSTGNIGIVAAGWR
jgi:hypothetical protein